MCVTNLFSFPQLWFIIYCCSSWACIFKKNSFFFKYWCVTWQLITKERCIDLHTFLLPQALHFYLFSWIHFTCYCCLSLAAFPGWQQQPTVTLGILVCTLQLLTIALPPTTASVAFWRSCRLLVILSLTVLSSIFICYPFSGETSCSFSSKMSTVPFSPSLTCSGMYFDCTTEAAL